jgi:CspA family cold shock protein
MATMNGTIKRLTDKGFGFIAASDGSEYFFHQSACSGTRFDDLREGQAVTFERGQGPNGLVPRTFASRNKKARTRINGRVNTASLNRCRSGADCAAWRSAAPIGSVGIS